MFAYKKDSTATAVSPNVGRNKNSSQQKKHRGNPLWSHLSTGLLGPAPALQTKPTTGKTDDAHEKAGHISDEVVQLNAGGDYRVEETLSETPVMRMPTPPVQAQPTDNFASQNESGVSLQNSEPLADGDDEWCLNVKKSPDPYSLYQVDEKILLEDSYCLPDKGKKNSIRIDGNWHWHKYRNHIDKVYNPKVKIEFDWLDGHLTEEVTVNSIDARHPTKIVRTVHLTPISHEEGIEDSVDITIKVDLPESDKALSGSGTVKQLK